MLRTLVAVETLGLIRRLGEYYSALKRGLHPLGHISWGLGGGHRANQSSDVLQLTETLYYLRVVRDKTLNLDLLPFCQLTVNEAIQQLVNF